METEQAAIVQADQDELAARSAELATNIATGLLAHTTAKAEYARASRRWQETGMALEVSCLRALGELRPDEDTDPLELVCGNTLIRILPSKSRPNLEIRSVFVAGRDCAAVPEPPKIVRLLVERLRSMAIDAGGGLVAVPRPAFADLVAILDEDE